MGPLLLQMYSWLKNAALEHFATQRKQQHQQQCLVEAGKPDGGSPPASSSSPVQLGVLVSLVIAASAGIINQLLTMPIGTVATRIVVSSLLNRERAFA